MLRTPDAERRAQRLKVVTLRWWERLMPEVFDECQDVLAVIRQRRPDWLLAQPDLASFLRLRSNWQGGHGFWRRARTDPSGEAARLASLEGDELALAREEAHGLRDDMKDLHFDSLELVGWTAHLRDGTEVDLWRFETTQYWWSVL